MNTVQIVIQVIIALGIFNVWLLRYNKPTPWRGGEAKNMREEFEAYGLSRTTMLLVGGLKCLFALGLIIGIWVPWLAEICALGIALLMIAAIAMHVKVQDPPRKSLPAGSLLLLSLFVAFV